MRRSDFDYHLPDELIAQRPLESRGDSRLLCLDGATGVLHDRRFPDLLELLLTHDGRVVTQEEIREHLWRHGEEASEGAVRVYITRLKKLFPGAIENIRGVGYRFHRERIGHEPS